MGLADITKEGIQAAIAEFDRLGRDRFLATHGFRSAQGYFLVEAGKRYDSKAIVGVAHGLSRPGLQTLGAGEFSGGEATVASLLERLGFVVDRPTSSENLATESPSTESLATKRNPTWSPEELILALDLYLREGVLDHSHNLVVELSEALNKLPIHSDRPDAARFRNPNGVALKLANFAALDPGHPGKGMTRGGKRDSEIWNKFSGDEDALREAAEKIRAGVDWPLPRSSASVLAQVSTIELEALNTEHFVVHRATTAEAVRREQQLVRDYAEHLLAQGHKIVRHKYDLEGNPLYCDLFDETSWLLHEAKGDVRRESVRMAVGQLLDYARFYQKKPKLVVLLPREPSADIKEFLAAVGIQGVFRDSSGAWARSTVSAVPTPA